MFLRDVITLILTHMHPQFSSSVWHCANSISSKKRNHFFLWITEDQTALRSCKHTDCAEVLKVEQSEGKPAQHSVNQKQTSTLDCFEASALVFWPPQCWCLWSQRWPYLDGRYKSKCREPKLVSKVLDSKAQSNSWQCTFQPIHSSLKVSTNGWGNN